MIDHRFDLYDSGIKVAEIQGIKNINWGYKRNEFVSCSFELNANKIDSTLLEYLKEGSEIRIYRKKYYGDSLELIYAGEIQVPEKTEDEKLNRTIKCEVTANGEVYLTNRFITKQYTQIEENEIAWDVINEIQTDVKEGAFTLAQVNWGITRGSEEATENIRDREYEDMEVLNALQNLANVLDTDGNPQRLRGFKLSPDITTHTYNVWQWCANLGTSKNITYTNSSIKKVKSVKSIKALKNRITALGKDDLRQSANSASTPELDRLKMREGFISKTDVTTLGEITDIALDELSVRKNPPTIYSIELIENDYFIGEYGIGDYINIEYSSDFLPISGTFQVFEINISLDENGIEKASIVIAQAKPLSTETESSDKLASFIKRSNKRLLDLEK